VGGITQTKHTILVSVRGRKTQFEKRKNSHQTSNLLREFKQMHEKAIHRQNVLKQGNSNNYH
jgi:hypothetical protein